MLKALNFRLLKSTFVIPKKNLSNEVEYMRKIAIVLSGSGYLDGSEIFEATSTAIHIAKNLAEPIFFAPDIKQSEVVNHLKKSCVDQERNVLIESARIARSDVCSLSNLKVCDYDGVIFPGGFGVAKNLTSFAYDGQACTINEDVVRILHEFRQEKKPLGFMCISAILPAKIFPGCRITLGKDGDPKLWPHASVIKAALKMGAEVENRDVLGYSFDREHIVFSTPAFMYEGTFYEIYEGIGSMIHSFMQITN